MLSARARQLLGAAGAWTFVGQYAYRRVHGLAASTALRQLAPIDVAMFNAKMLANSDS